MFPWEKLVSSEKRLHFDGYAWMNECSTTQLIIVEGSATAAGMLGWIKTIKENGRLEC